MGVSSIHRVAAVAAISFALTFSSVQGYTSALNVNTRGGGVVIPNHQQPFVLADIKILLEAATLLPFTDGQINYYNN